MYLVTAPFKGSTSRTVNMQEFHGKTVYSLGKRGSLEAPARRCLLPTATANTATPASKANIKSIGDACLRGDSLRDTALVAPALMGSVATTATVAAGASVAAAGASVTTAGASVTTAGASVTTAGAGASVAAAAVALTGALMRS